MASIFGGAREPVEHITRAPSLQWKFTVQTLALLMITCGSSWTLLCLSFLIFTMQGFRAQPLKKWWFLTLLHQNPLGKS